MMLYLSLVAIHVATMLGAFALLVLTELIFVSARRGLASHARLGLAAGRVAGILIAVGLVSGIALLFLGGWSLLTPWLLLSFALIGLLIGVESVLVSPWQAKVRPAVQDDRFSAELGDILGDKRALSGRLTMIVLFALITATMMTKPDIYLPL